MRVQLCHALFDSDSIPEWRRVLAQAKLKAVIFCQPQARRFSNEPLSMGLHLPDRLAAGQRPDPGEIGTQFASPYLRPADVPLAFHRESPLTGSQHASSMGQGIGHSSTGARLEMSVRLEAFGRMLQYLFDDGKVLTGHQILYHPYSKVVPRHLLPLTINVKSDLQDKASYVLDSGPQTGSFRPTWQIQAEHVILSVLLSTLRAVRQAAIDTEDDRNPQALWFCLDDKVEIEREALRLDGLELLPDTWGPWRVTTALPEPVSGVHYGRARLELDPEQLGNLEGLGRAFFVNVETRRLLFHTFEEQMSRLQLQAPKAPPAPPGDTQSPALETGVSLHLSGHANIQATLQEINDLLAPAGRQLPLYPASTRISRDHVKPHLSLTSDGSFRLRTKVDAPGGQWEVHGIPQGCAYLILNLQGGLGATTGYSNTQIAHARRGLKRERDMKVLRNLGFSLLVFFDAVNFALGLPLSDGSEARTEDDLRESLFTRLGALILKAEGWPMQSGSLVDLCSKNVTTLIEGFVAQVIRDMGVDGGAGRDTHLYMPEGELRVEGLTRAVILLLHALVADLAAETNGACFTRARTKTFENFLNGRTAPEREDVAVRAEVDPQVAARFIYQPGIGERYLMPESSIPPRGANVFALLTRGFDLSIDGKQIEEFDASEFRPEFRLREDGEAEEQADGSGAVPLGPRKIDWFELHPKFFFKGVEITPDQATRLSKDGMIEFQGKLFRVKPKDMPSLKRLTQFWSTIQSHAAGLLRAKRRRTEETYYKLPRSQTLELLALRATGVKVRGGPRWDEVTKFYDSLNEQRAPLELPESFKTALQPYQMTGVQWLRDLMQLGLGGILADDMGLGKTVTSLAFLESLRAEDRMGPCLILVPTSLTYNWLSEAERFAPDMPFAIFSSREPESTLDFIQSQRHSAIVCTYGLLQEHTEIFQQVEWGCVIFDEAQNLKNITTKRTTAARKLRSAFKVCLTGTPLENHYGEFYSLFDLIVPGSLGDLPDFREKFVNPVRVLKEDLDFLRLKTKPLLLRRTKAQVMAQLPPKIETTIKLPFEEQQKAIYRDIATSYNEQIRSQIATHGESKMQLQMLTALLRLRQACSDPAAIPGVKYTGEPPKITTLLEALGELTEGGASALVFTQFLATFERIRTSLLRAKIPFYDISGSDSRANRERKLKAFQEENSGAVMLMTLKTGGVGLNLTKASYVFHIEPWWNPAVENQATDRAHRIGQQETVQVYRYLIRESVEEKIEVLKDLKSKRFDALFSVSESEGEMGGPGGSALTQRDFEYLLS